MDFMHDPLTNGRKFRTLNVVDVYTRECRAIEVDTSFGGQMTPTDFARRSIFFNRNSLIAVG
ncbi:MAG: hypothetical protein IVW55_10935 [Chloroflexi bacterium]|nr:hypothetical protein [Chloroflexota bacterium]